MRCTHGSTSGKVDEELIFYARSRGFTRKEAVRMIVTGFFQQIFDRITIESVREALDNRSRVRFASIDSKPLLRQGLTFSFRWPAIMISMPTRKMTVSMLHATGVTALDTGVGLKCLKVHEHAAHLERTDRLPRYARS